MRRGGGAPEKPRLPKKGSGGGKVLDHALSALRIKRENVMSYQIYDDRVVVVEGPSGRKRTYMFPGCEDAEA